MNYKRKFILINLSFFIFTIPFVSANPIPVFPNPEPSYVSPVTYVSSNQGLSLLIPFVFLLDFAANLLIIYFCFFLLDKAHLISLEEFQRISRYQIILTAGIISCFGILFEFLLGTWITGLGIILLVVFISYYIFCSYFFHISKNTTLYFSIIAVLINIGTWSIYFYVL